MLLFSIISIVGFTNNPVKRTTYNMVEKDEAVQNIYIVNDNYCFYNNDPFELFLSTIKVSFNDLAKVDMYQDRNKIDSILVDSKGIKSEDIKVLLLLDLKKDVKLDLQELEKYK